MIAKADGYGRCYRVLYVDGVRKRESIGRNQELVAKLCHKAFLQEKLRRLRCNIAAAETALQESMALDVPEIIKSLPKYHDRLDAELLERGRHMQSLAWPRPSRDPAVLPSRAALTTGDLSPERWGSLAYCENTSFLEHKTHQSARGVFCRSKSEVAILEFYDSLGIPYHYDETLLFGRHRQAPDIIVARADGVLIFHEHYGLQDDDYLHRRAWKTSLYESCGIREGKNLICTFDREDGSLNMSLVAAQIKDMYGLV